MMKKWTQHVYAQLLCSGERTRKAIHCFNGVVCEGIPTVFQWVKHVETVVILPFFRSFLWNFPSSKSGALMLHDRSPLRLKKPYQGRKFDPSHLEIMVSMSPVNYAGLAFYFVVLGVSMVASYYMQRSPCRRAASWLLIAITWFYILRFTITYPQTSWYQEGGDGHPELAILMSRCQHQGTNIGFHSHAVIWQGWNICTRTMASFPT